MFPWSIWRLMNWRRSCPHTVIYCLSSFSVSLFSQVSRLIFSSCYMIQIHIFPDIITVYLLLSRENTKKKKNGKCYGKIGLLYLNKSLKFKGRVFKFILNCFLFLEFLLALLAHIYVIDYLWLFLNFNFYLFYQSEPCEGSLCLIFIFLEPNTVPSTW